MSNAIYPEWKDAIATGAANSALNGGNVKVLLVDLADYTFDVAHEFLSSIPAAARVAISAALTGVTITAGVVDADDTTFSSVSGDQSEALIWFIDTGVEATSRLVVYLDSGYTNLPVTPSGGNIQVAWDNGANKVFKL